MAYATADELREYLKASAGVGDEILETYIARAQAIIDRTTMRRFEIAGDSVKYFHAIENVEDHGLYLFFDEDLFEITTVLNGDGSEILSTQYITEPRNELPYFGLKLRSTSDIAWTYEDDPEEAIAIEGKWGYSETPPADIVHATVRLAAYLYRQRDTSIEFDRAIISGVGTILPPQLPSDVMEILKSYTRLT